MSRPSHAHPTQILSRYPKEGWWKQEVWDRSGSLVDPGIWRKNLIVDKVSELLAWLFKEGGPSGPSGIQYYALGSGLTSWDTTLPPPASDDVQLETEIVDGMGVAVSRRVPTIEYLDDDDLVTLTKTNRLKLTVIYDYDELNDPGPPAQNLWREFGVFGGDADADTPDSGYMINHVTNGVFTKTALLKVRRTLNFQF